MDQGNGIRRGQGGQEEAKAKPAVASSGDLSFEALLAKHRAQQSKTKEVKIEDVRESEMDAKEALEAKRTAEDCFAVHELYQEMKKVLQEMLMGLLRSWKN